MRYLKYIVLLLFGVSLTYASQVITIEQLQGHSSDSPYNGQEITTYGIVTGVYVNSSVKGFTLEEKYPASGPWHGVFVYTGISPTVSVGDSVEVTGLVQEYYGLTELHGDTVNILASGVQLPDPYITTADSLKTEAFEGVYVTLQHAVCDSLPNSYGEWWVNDGTASIMVDDLGWSATGINVGEKYNITGTIYYAYGEYRIEPRGAYDVTPDTANTPPFVYLLSFEPKLPESDETVRVLFKAVERDAGDSITADTLFVSTDSFHTVETAISILGSLNTTIDSIQNDSFFVYYIPRHAQGTRVYFYLKVADSHGATSQTNITSYIVNPGDEIIPISYLHILDDMGHSVFLGKSVKIQGVVTVAGDFGKKYYMQDHTGGVVLYNPVTPLIQGDSVIITGYVTEYSGVVELDNATATYQDPGHSVYPKIVNCHVLSEGKEAYEGMFVQISHVTTNATSFAGGSTITIQDGTGSYTLYVDPSTDLVGKPVPSGEMTIRGVISQYDPDSTDGYFDGYQLVPRGVKDIMASGNGSGKLSILPPFLHKGDTTTLTFLLTKDLANINAARFFFDTWADMNSISVNGASYTKDNFYHLTLYDFTQDTVKVQLRVTAPDTESTLYITLKTSETDTNSLQETLESPYRLFVTTPISEAQKPGEDGVTPEDTGKVVTVGGIVIGPNTKFSGSMTNLWIQDDTAGIEVFYYSPIQSFDTGDVVIVKGTITEYNGLTEITPDDASQIVYAGHVSPPSPIVLSPSEGIRESIEGALVTFEGSLDNTPYVQGSGYNMIVWNGTVPITVYVYKTTGIDVSGLKKGSIVRITGIAGQYDYTAPYNDGYQVLPRFQSDIELQSSPTTENVNLSVSPNVVDKTKEGFCTIHVSGPQNGNYSLRIYDASGKLIKDIYGTRRMGPADAQWKLDNMQGSIVPIGYYIVKIDVLLENGKHEVVYKPVVVTRPK